MLKGKSYERDYRDKANSIFGRFIRRGRNRTDDIADQLYEAVDEGIVSNAEITQVLAADLLWGGKLRGGEDEAFIVLEASWRAEINDVERARLRADILHKIGLIAVPVVAGMVWDDEAKALAHSQTVVSATDGLIDNDCWQNGLSAARSKVNLQIA